MAMNSRRDALRSLAAGALIPALNGQHQHSEPLVQIVKPVTPKVFSTEDFKLLSQLVDTILPRTDTPGAFDAGVPHYIDRYAGKHPSTEKALKAGLTKLSAAGFLQAGPDQRIAALKEMEANQSPFFQLIKDLTIDGYYSSREGLAQELGYHGKTFLTEFPGCTHPEHMPAGGGATHAD